MKKNIIEKLLVERISLRGICRVINVSLTWQFWFFRRVTDNIPNDNSIIKSEKSKLCIELDEIRSFVRKKKKKRWIWLAFDRNSGQIAGFHIGNRTRKDAKKLWKSLPGVYRQRAVCYSDFLKLYEKVISENRHRPSGKETGQTNHIGQWHYAD